jgi:Outer membrane protein beta-barrel domain
MRKILVVICFAIPFTGLAQVSIGLKGGLNFANVTNASSINNSNRTGFNVSLFLEPGKARLLSYRTELTYSRQGYNFSTDTNSGNVNLDYIVSSHFMCINITRFFQVHFGGQIAYLIGAKADSTSNTSGQPGSSTSVLGYSVRADYGFGAGVEARPVMGLVIGVRYNLSLSSVYNTTSLSNSNNGQPPTFTPPNAHNNVVQLYAGWRFSKKQKKKMA